jgi:hypothetical protein
MSTVVDFFKQSCSAFVGAPLTNLTIPSSHRLLDDLFRHYRKEIRPVTNSSLPVNVEVHLWFKQVLKVVSKLCFAVVISINLKVEIHKETVL